MTGVLCFPETNLPVTPSVQLSFILGQHVTTLCKLVVLTNIGKVVLLYIPKISHYVLNVFVRNDHLGNIVGQDQEFRMTGVGKRYCEE
jgi:hypothetical protein